MAYPIFLEKIYSPFIKNLLKQYSDKFLIISADFNFNPYTIGSPEERALDFIPHNNSQLLKIDSSTASRKIEAVTVDGILLSIIAKQMAKQNLEPVRIRSYSFLFTLNDILLSTEANQKQSTELVKAANNALSSLSFFGKKHLETYNKIKSEELIKLDCTL